MNEETRYALGHLAAHAELAHQLVEWRAERKLGRGVRPAEIVGVVEELCERHSISMWLEDGSIRSRIGSDVHSVDVSDLYGTEEDAEYLDEQLEELDDDDLEERGI